MSIVKPVIRKRSVTSIPLMMLRSMALVAVEWDDTHLLEGRAACDAPRHEPQEEMTVAPAFSRRFTSS